MKISKTEKAFFGFGIIGGILAILSGTIYGIYKVATALTLTSIMKGVFYFAVVAISIFVIILFVYLCYKVGNFVYTKYGVE